MHILFAVIHWGSYHIEEMVSCSLAFLSFFFKNTDSGVQIWIEFRAHRSRQSFKSIWSQEWLNYSQMSTRWRYKYSQFSNLQLISINLLALIFFHLENIILTYPAFGWKLSILTLRVDMKQILNVFHWWITKRFKSSKNLEFIITFVAIAKNQTFKFYLQILTTIFHICYC